MASCPGCGSVLDVDAAEMRAANPSFKVSKPAPRTLVLEPRAHTGQYKCLECAKTFTFSKDHRDLKQKYTKPHCSECGSPKVQSITPIAAVQTTDPEGADPKKAKLARFVKRNFKALCELRTYFGNFESMLSRAALTSKQEQRIKSRMKAIQDEILQVVESTADQRLQERMRSLGIASGEDVF